MSAQESKRVHRCRVQDREPQSLRGRVREGLLSQLTLIILSGWEGGRQEEPTKCAKAWGCEGVSPGWRELKAAWGEYKYHMGVLWGGMWA